MGALILKTLYFIIVRRLMSEAVIGYLQLSYAISRLRLIIIHFILTSKQWAKLLFSNRVSIFIQHKVKNISFFKHNILTSVFYTYWDETDAKICSKSLKVRNPCCLVEQYIFFYVLEFSRSVQMLQKLLISTVWILGIIVSFSQNLSIYLLLTLTVTVLGVLTLDGCPGRTAQLIPPPRSQPPPALLKLFDKLFGLLLISFIKEPYMFFN